MADLYLTRRQLLLLKLETIEGIDAAPEEANSGDSLRLIDPWTLELQQEFNEVGGGNISRSDDEPIPGVVRASVRFRTYLTGASASAFTDAQKPPVSPALQACGLQESFEISGEAGTTYNYIPTVDISSDMSATIVAHIDGFEHRLVNCRGNVNLIFGANAPVIAEFDFKGRLTTEAATTRSAPAGLPTIVPPKWIDSGSVLIDSVSCLNMEAFNLNTNNEIYEEKSMSSTSGSGINRVILTGRSPGGSMDPAAIDPSTHNAFNSFRAGTRAQISLKAGAETANIVTLAMSNAIYKSVGWEDKTGVGIWDISYQAYQSHESPGDRNFELGFPEAPSFAPSDVDSILLWLDASRITSGGLADGSVVSTWADISGNAHHASQVTGDKKPIYYDNIIDANPKKPIVRFDGDNDILVNTPVSLRHGTQPTTMILAWTCRDVAGNNHPIDGGADAAGNPIYRSTITAVGGKYRTSAGATLNQPAGYPGSAVDSEWVITTLVFDSTSSAFYKNGAIGLSGNMGTDTMSAGYILGSYTTNATFGAGDLDGDIAEVIVYDGKLSDVERDKVEVYLSRKYDIPLFNPHEIAGMLFWLDASQVTSGGLADGSVVSTWADVGSNGHHASQITASKKPTYHVNVLKNNKPIIRFDGTNDVLVNTPVSFVQSTHPFTLFVAWSAVDQTDLDHVIDGGNAPGGGGRMSLYSGIAPNAAFHAMGNGTALYSSNTIATPGALISTAMFDTVSSALYKNGVLDATGDTGSSSIDTGYILGNWKVDGSGPLDGDIAEVIVYDTKLSDTDREIVQSYLSKKYNIPL